MYKRPPLQDYKNKWLQAERVLAVRGAQPIHEISRDDFMDALKKACQRNPKTSQSAPKSS